MHRHARAQALLCLSEPDGGLGLSAKVVQERLGHSSITMTMDRVRPPIPRWG
jgi:integrase